MMTTMTTTYEDFLNDLTHQQSHLWLPVFQCAMNGNSCFLV